MRDPLRPIPSPAVAEAFWQQSAPPPVDGARMDASRYDPTRLVRHRELDARGLDRRSAPRSAETEGPETTIVGTAHRQIRAMAGLSTRGGWALVETITVAPQGAIVRSVDPMDPSLDAKTRTRARRACASLSPILGAAWTPDAGARPVRATPPAHPSSMLGNVGAVLLGGRVLEDLFAWATGTRHGGSPSRHLDVTLVIPTPRGDIAQVGGEVVPLHDPRPDVVGVAVRDDVRPALTRALGLA